MFRPTGLPSLVSLKLAPMAAHRRKPPTLDAPMLVIFWRSIPRIAFFCGSADAAWECAHLCPHSVNPALSPLPLFFRHQSTVDHPMNHERACSNCHYLFDHGAFYVDADDEFKICKSTYPDIVSLLRFDPDFPFRTIEDLQSHFDRNLKDKLQLPAAGSLWYETFPILGTQFYCIWAWRRQYFEYYAAKIPALATKFAASSVSQLSACFKDLSLSIHITCDCGVNNLNQRCTFRLCKSCCLGQPNGCKLSGHANSSFEDDNL
jgi:hypothetical protein